MCYLNLPAGHSQGAHLRRVLVQLVWPDLLQGHVVILAPTHPPRQDQHEALAAALPPNVPVDPLSPTSILVPVHLLVPQAQQAVHLHPPPDQHLVACRTMLK